MLYPSTARVRCQELARVFRNTRILGLSLVRNRVIGCPILMIAEALAFLPDKPDSPSG